MIPFSPDVYFRALATYAETLWPGQIIAGLLGLLVIGLLIRPTRLGSRAAGALLAIGWLTVGIGYYANTFAPLNWAAWIGTGAYGIQSILLAWTGVVRPRIALRFDRMPMATLGLALMVFGLATGPAGALAGVTPWTAITIAGLHPGPTVMFTLGYFLLARGRLPVWLMIIPVLAGLFSAAASILLTTYDALLLIPACVGVLIVVGLRNRRESS